MGRTVCLKRREQETVTTYMEDMKQKADGTWIWADTSSAGSRDPYAKQAPPPQGPTDSHNSSTTPNTAYGRYSRFKPYHQAPKKKYMVGEMELAESSEVTNLTKGNVKDENLNIWNET